ncbi:hypothetical protein BCR33DRAFT_262606 [Rhizoclosmatium globosum]|uniref:Uncharacterized protein n=1 Tax=Rhizoclosmatium globosum TaxID=329046 RepID=A0A1Y2C8Z3_9FUNG|nr:hypothetical protein BCR33DRAFT_262606 [Rhizoclosmatium globosum]|eukprot:ORY43500.1 hypothetical protein BCR33DRAFT_262606 [Rhizoclosmatium globosum]
MTTLPTHIFPHWPSFPPHFFVLGALSGLCFEVAIGGLLTIATKLQGPLKSKVTVSIVGACNILCLWYTGMQLGFWLISNPTTCFGFAIVSNISSHLFFLAFDAFVLFVTYYITNKDKKLRQVNYILLIHRFVWAIADIYMSRGYWDGNQCSYTQNSITGIGYNCADIITDIFATVSAIYASRKRFNPKSLLVRALMEKNVCRTAIIFLQSITLTVFSATNQTQFAQSVTWLIQTYTMGRCLNYDLLFNVDPDNYQTLGSALRRASKSIKSLVVPGKIHSEETKEAWVALASEAGRRCSVAMSENMGGNGSVTHSRRGSIAPSLQGGRDSVVLNPNAKSCVSIVLEASMESMFSTTVGSPRLFEEAEFHPVPIRSKLGMDRKVSQHSMNKIPVIRGKISSTSIQERENDVEEVPMPPPNDRTSSAASPASHSTNGSMASVRSNSSINRSHPRRSTCSEMGIPSQKPTIKQSGLVPLQATDAIISSSQPSINTKFSPRTRRTSAGLKPQGAETGSQCSIRSVDSATGTSKNQFLKRIRVSK